MRMWAGRDLYIMKATRGFPLDMAIDEILNLSGAQIHFIEWPSYIEAARRDGRWDFQTYADLSNALEDCQGYSKEQKAEILQLFKAYVLKYPHPKMVKK